MSFKLWLMILSALSLVVANECVRAGASRAVFAFSGGEVARLELNGTTTLEASNQGWWDQFGSHASDNPSYVAGLCGTSDACMNLQDTVYRDFFVFDLSNFVGTVNSAKLILFNPADPPGPGYISTHPVEIFEVRGINISPLNLTANGTLRTDIFNDLGSGSLYGQVSISEADDGTDVTIALNALSVQTIRATVGSTIAFSGSVRDIPEPRAACLTAVGLGLLIWRIGRVNDRRCAIRLPNHRPR